MQIVHVVPLMSTKGAYGGPLSVARGQVQELRRRGHSVELLTGWTEAGSPPISVGDTRISAFRARSIIPRIGVSGLLSIGLVLRLFKLAKSADILHVHTGRELVGASAMIIGAITRTATIVQTHGMLAPDSRLRARIADLMYVRPLHRRSKVHLYLTNAERTDLQNLLGDAFGTFKLLPNGVHPYALPRGENGSLVREVIFCSRLHSRKRPLSFVECAGLVTSENVKFTLIGPDEGELEGVLSKIKEKNLSMKVSYEGSLPYQSVLERISRADIYVLPSIDEPFPMALLEAMSIGLPCIVTNSTGISDHLASRGAAIVTDGSVASIAKSVDELLNSPEKRVHLGDAARLTISEDFSVVSVVDELEDIYRDQ